MRYSSTNIFVHGGHYPCRLEAVRREYRKIDNGMVYQKNWPFTRLFNHHLLILKERGIFVQIQNVHMDYHKVIIFFFNLKSFKKLGKVHIFWEGHKILRNLHRRFDWHYIRQIYGGDFEKFCDLLRMYELYFERHCSFLCNFW